MKSYPSLEDLYLNIKNYKKALAKATTKRKAKRKDFKQI